MCLAETARAENDAVVVSHFVNPLQFGPHEDLDRYPRDWERDRKLLEQAEVDAVYRPSRDVMYPPESSTRVRVSGVTNTFEGAARPGHFEGVATVVTKLFAAVQPDRAYFGQKDAQQVAAVKRLVADLDLGVDPGRADVREPDGLAMSSRNAYPALRSGRRHRRCLRPRWSGRRGLRRREDDLGGWMPAGRAARVAGVCRARGCGYFSEAREPCRDRRPSWENEVDRQPRPGKGLSRVSHFCAVQLTLVLAEAVLTTKTTPIIFRGFVFWQPILVQS
jgi:hypothetical protein